MAANRAAELRAAREAFVFAEANGVTVAAARAELARRRWAEVDAKLATRRCGTKASATPIEEQDEGRELAWWQR